MKKLLLFALAILPISGYSQIVLKHQLPFSGLYTKTQLWNISIVNATSETIYGQIEISFSNAYNNQRVFSATTRLITFPSGLTQLNSNVVIPINYNIVNPDYNISSGQDGFLPLGSFNVCYTFVGIRGDISERMAEECEVVDVEPISPPILISPDDSGTIEISRPIFNWLPPAPAQQFNGLSYEFKLVEVADMQNGPDAVQKNIPLHRQSGVLANSLQYPVGLPELSRNKLYAWQIVAYSSEMAVAESEIWTFKLTTNEKDEPKVIDQPYIKLDKSQKPGYSLSKQMFRFHYLNESADTLFSFKLFDLTNGKKQLKENVEPVILKYGPNFHEIDLSNYLMVDQHLYLFELTTSKNQRWFAKFQYRK